MEWFAAKHALLAHLPVAAGLLLPFALMAALRPGRGIRPWWTACRYLGWAGMLGLLACLASGVLLAPATGRIAPGHWIPWAGASELRRHSLLALASLPLAVLTLWAMHRPRKEHQGFGVLPLFFGLLWAAASLATGWTGHTMVHPDTLLFRKAAPAIPPAPLQAPRPVPPRADPEAKIPVRALDFAALEPVTPEPLKSAAHGGRWIRVWVSPEALGAYRAGAALPEGALVVMSTQEDRWGRPGPDPGPLYALEEKGGQPRLTFYWARVPESDRAETGGQARVYWRSPDPHLAGCQACHAAGLSDISQRSHWMAPRRPKPPVAPPAPARGQG
jgi:hypothetical protein